MISKRYKALPQETRMLKHDKIENLLKIIKKNCTAKFDESVDVHFRLNLKQKKSEANIRTVLNLPVAKNKKIRVAVICEEEKLEEAKRSDADIVGSDDLINDIGGAQRTGMKGVLVRTGKFRKSDLSHSDVKPDFIIESIDELEDILSLL